MKVIDVVCAIIERDGLILLAQRDGSSDQAGLWEFPGGKVEPEETQPQALKRELQEELAISASVDRYIASNQWDLPDKAIHLHAWLVSEYRGKLRLSNHSALLWVTPTDAQQLNLAPADIPLLTAYIHQRASA